MGVLRGPSHVVELANAAYYKLVGHRDMLGKPLLEALPEIKGQGLIEVLDRILVIAEPYVGTNVAVFLQRAPGARLEERLQRGYFDDHFSKCRESAKIEVLRSPRRIHESH